MVAAVPASAQQPQKPNILVIMGDDIGYWNVSAYNRRQMGYHTPNIDRIANEGAIFTDYYGQQSCTAGRAAFITGQSPLRTGLLKVGLPAAKEGLSDKDPTIAELLKPQGYVTGQFGKNHLGDRNEFLPTVHGFDAFFGNLYHLNAEEEPENLGLSEKPELPGAIRPARRSQVRRDHNRHAGGRSPLRPVGQAEMRRHRPPHRAAHGDDRRGVSAGHNGIHRRRGARSQPVLRVVQLDPHAYLDAPQARTS
jgi:arylsulfatase A-like enzyme